MMNGLKMLCALLLLTLVNTSIKAQEDLAEYKQDNYRIKYPKSWELDNSGDLGTMFIIYSQLASAQDQFKENVNLVVQPLAKKYRTLPDYIAVVKKQIDNLTRNGKGLISESKPIKINGSDGYKFIYKAHSGMFKLKFEQYYFSKKGKAYILTFTCEENQFTSYKDQGERILNSFQLK